MTQSLPHVARITLAIVLLSAGAGCVSVYPHTVPVYPATRPEKGLIYFFREKQFFGSGVSYYLYRGKTRIGGLKNGTYFFHWCDPGEHTFWARTEAKSTVTVSVEGGIIYYVRGSVTMGGLAHHPALSLVSEAYGFEAVRKLTFVTLAEDQAKKVEQTH